MMMTRMIRASLAAAALLLAPITAQAADMPRQAYKAPLYAPSLGWTGFYLGLNGGYMWGSSQWSGGAGSFEVSPDGWLGGGTIGVNLQTGFLVWGLEADIDYANLNGTNGAACAGCTIKDTWLGTARARLGYSFDRWLPFVTGGLAYGNAYVSTPGGAVDRTKAGWTAGAGVEYAFMGPWSAKLEYLYVDLGSTTCDSATCVLPADATVDFTANIVRLGVNYRF
jgi:outer membrane immunogenic protein